MTLLKVKEAMEKLAIGRNSLYLLIRSGEIAAVKIGGRTRLIDEDLDQWIKERMETWQMRQTSRRPYVSGPKVTDSVKNASATGKGRGHPSTSSTHQSKRATPVVGS